MHVLPIIIGYRGCKVRIYMKIKRFQKKRNEDKESAQKICNFDKL